MRRESILVLTLLSFLLALGVFPMSSSFSTPGPTVWVDPADGTEFEIGTTVVVTVEVFNLTDAEIPDPLWPFYMIPLGNLWSFGVNLTWDPTVLQYVSHTVTIPVETYPDGILHEPYIILLEDLNAGAGLYSLKATSQSGAEPFNNPGVSNKIFIMTFTSLSLGSSPLSLPSVTLYDKIPKPIGVDINGDKVFIYVQSGNVKFNWGGDCNRSGKVDYDDFIILAGAYGTGKGHPAYDERADFEGDDTVDYDDFIILAGRYGQNAPPYP